MVVAYPGFECLLVRVIVYTVLFLIWALFVVIVVALLVERDSAFVDRFVSQQTEPLANRVKELREEHGGVLEDIRLQMDDLEERTRSALEEVGGKLRPRDGALKRRDHVRSSNDLCDIVCVRRQQMGEVSATASAFHGCSSDLGVRGSQTRLVRGGLFPLAQELCQIYDDP